VFTTEINYIYKIDPWQMAGEFRTSASSASVASEAKKATKSLSSVGSIQASKMLENRSGSVVAAT
jgi:hypothetical protein